MRTHPLVFAALLAIAGCNQPTTEATGALSSSGSSTTGGSTGGASSTGGAGSTGASTASSSTTGAGATTGSSGSSSSSTGGTSGQSGDCANDADCSGSHCVEITPGGFRVCQQPLTPPEACGGGGNDQCCPNGTACAGGAACVLGPVFPVCAGIARDPGNECAADQCQTDADCSDQSVCAPAGTMGLQARACVYAACKRDADCNAEPGGKCEPVPDACCGTVYGLYCVYPDGCRSRADCSGSEYCAPGASPGASCQPGMPPCPV